MSAGTALLFIFLSGMRIDFAQASPTLQFIAGVLLASVVLRRRWRGTVVGDCLGSQGVVWLSGLVCGFISLVGLHLHLPRVDHILLSLDHAIGLDGAAYVSWVSQWPDQAQVLLAAAYAMTVPIVLLSLILQSVLKRSLEVWRGAFCFTGGLLTVCLVSMLTPAKGMGVWLADETLAQLPPGSARYFWHTFDRFYEGKEVVLKTGSIDGVVSFPSFHMIMGLITLTLWRANPFALLLSFLWFAPMLAAMVPLGGHYFIDLIGGVAVWAAWFAFSRRIGARPSPSSPLRQREARQPA